MLCRSVGRSLGIFVDRRQALVVFKAFVDVDRDNSGEVRGAASFETSPCDGR